MSRRQPYLGVNLPDVVVAFFCVERLSEAFGLFPESPFLVSFPLAAQFLPIGIVAVSSVIDCPHISADAALPDEAEAGCQGDIGAAVDQVIKVALAAVVASAVTNWAVSF